MNSLKIQQWYEDLHKVKLYLVSVDPILLNVFIKVDENGFMLHESIKDPFTALIGVIIGQRISYKEAKLLRSKLYSIYGNKIDPSQLYKQDLSFLGSLPAKIITDVTEHILTYNIDITTESGIKSLIYVPGIGEWTITSTLVTSLLNWNLFPSGDKFLQNRLKKLYGTNYNLNIICDKWSPYKSLVTWYLWRWF